MCRRIEAEADGCAGWSLTPCPADIGRSTPFEGSVAIVRCGGYGDALLEFPNRPAGKDWIEIVKIVPCDQR